MQFKIKKVKKKQTGNKVIKLIYNRLEGLEKKNANFKRNIGIQFLLLINSRRTGANISIPGIWLERNLFK